MKNWTTANGKEIPIKELDNSHLINIINWVKKKSKQLDGAIIDGGGFDADDIWYVLGSEQDWLDKFGYKYLIKEKKRRNI